MNSEKKIMLGGPRPPKTPVFEGGYRPHPDRGLLPQAPYTFGLNPAYRKCGQGHKLMGEILKKTNMIKILSNFLMRTLHALYKCIDVMNEGMV